MAFTRTAVSTTGNFTSGSTSITGVASTTGMFVGMMVYGPQIRPDTVITAISGTTVTMDKTALGTATGAAITGQYIIQSGTDATPAGLAAMTGVTTLTGNSTNRRVVMDLGLNQLRIQGTLTHDPDEYEIIGNVRNGLSFEAGSNVTFGIERTVNGRKTYSKGTGLVSTYVGDFFTLFGVTFSGGVFNWYGGVLQTFGPISHSGNVFTTFSFDCVWRLSAISCQFRSVGTPTFNALTVQGIGVDAVFFLAGGWNAFTINYERVYYQTPAGGGSNRTILNPVFANNQAEADLRANQASGTQQVTTIKNPDVFPRLLKLSSNAYADFPVVESVALNVTNSANAAVGASEVVAYIRDTNNGARLNSTVTNYVNDRTYIAASNASGAISLGDVLTLVGVNPDVTTGTINLDYRSNFGNGSADFNIYLGGYRFNPAVTRQTLLGNNGRSVLWTMFDDSNVTLSRTAALALVGAKFNIDPATQTITVLANATLSEFYDATKAFKYQGTAAAFETPIKDALIVTASGDRLTEYTNWNLVVPSGVAFTKDTKFKELALTGTGRVTVNGSVNFPYRDADGLRVTVTGLDPEGFGITWFLRYKLTSSSTWTNISGTGNTALILVTDGAYDVQVRAPGYDWATNTLDTSLSLSVDMGLRYQQASDETPQYLKPYDAAVEAIFQYDPAVMQVSVSNTTGALITGNFAELYRATQRIMHIPALVWAWTNPIRANAVTQTIVIPNGNPISLYLTADSDNHVRLTCPVVHQDTGEAAYDRVKGNTAGFQIILGSPATAESAGLVDNVVKLLGGQTYEEAQASQMVLRGLLDQLKLVADAIKPRTDLIPDEPATSAEVLAIGTPLQAADYVEPDNESIASIKATVEAIEPTDISGLATSAQVQALGTPLQASAYTAPDNAGIAAIQTKVNTLQNPDLSGLATHADALALSNQIGQPLQAANYTPAPTSAANATAVRAELATELGRIDAAVSTRLATSGYTAPDNATIGQIKTKVDTLENTDVSVLPTLTEIEGSTVLAKADQVQAVADAVTDLGTPLQAGDYQAPPTAAELLEAGLAKETTAQAAKEAAEFAGSVAA